MIGRDRGSRLGSGLKTLSGLRYRFGGLVLTLLLVLASAGIAPARADYVVAPDVVVFCEPTLRNAITDLGTLWRKQTDIPVRVFTSPTWALLEQISHRARSDLVIGEGEAASDAATARQLIRPETLHPLWRNELVVAKTADGPSASRAATLASLAGKAPIAIVDPAAAIAGSEGKKALQALGLWDAVSAKSVGVVDTADASYLLLTGKVPLAVVYATDVAANPGFDIAEKLPEMTYGPIVYWVAETHHALSPNVERFLSYLSSPEAQQRLRADGLEVLP